MRRKFTGELNCARLHHALPYLFFFFFPLITARQLNMTTRRFLYFYFFLYSIS
jgi:hypothetical protein